MTTQISLSGLEAEVLREMAQQAGKSEQELLNELVEGLLHEAVVARRRAILQQAAGIWQDRTDLPDIEVMRKEWNHRIEPLDLDESAAA